MNSGGIGAQMGENPFRHALLKANREAQAALAKHHYAMTARQAAGMLESEKDQTIEALGKRIDDEHQRAMKLADECGQLRKDMAEQAEALGHATLTIARLEKELRRVRRGVT